MESNHSLVDSVESKRLQLEEQVTKLRKALQHWQRWEAEYEGLKEDISTLTATASSEDVLQVAQNFDSDVLDRKELDEILGLDKGILRAPLQICGVLDRRVEYVQRNAVTVARRLYDLEGELEQMMFDAMSDNDGDGTLPAADIVEELDEEDNVVSFHVSNPDEDKSKLKNVLEKMGVDADSKSATALHADNTEQGAASSEIDTPEPINNSSPLIATDIAHETASFGKSNKVKDEDKVKPSSIKGGLRKSDSQRKKSVAWAEGTKAEAVEGLNQSSSYSAVNGSRRVLRKHHLPPGSTLDPDAQANLETVMTGTFQDTDRVLELDDDLNVVAASVPHIPTNESPEDARKRRDMLQYSLSEVGAIVAELDLEEASTDSEDYSEADTDEDENENGMTTSSNISEDYRKTMLALEERLNAQAMTNVGPSVNQDSIETHINAARNAPVKTQDPRPESTNVTVPSTSSHEGKEPKRAIKHSDARGKTSPAVSDVIAERPPLPSTTHIRSEHSRQAHHNASSTFKPISPDLDEPVEKVSRFKASRLAK